MTEDYVIVNPEKQYSDDKNNWAKLRIKKDTITKEKYIDVLIGRKGKKHHMHFGLNFEQSLRFMLSRKTGCSIRRTVDSKLRGRIADDFAFLHLNNKPANCLIFKLNINDKNEIRIKSFKFDKRVL